MTSHIRVAAVASELTISDRKAKCSSLMTGLEYEKIMILLKKASKQAKTAAKFHLELILW